MSETKMGVCMKCKAKSELRGQRPAEYRPGLRQMTVGTCPICGSALFHLEPRAAVGEGT